MKKLLVTFTITALPFMPHTSIASDFHGASVTDRNVPTAAWKAGITGIHPTIDDIALDSPAKTAGFATGDIILSINGEAVHKTAELKQLTDHTQKIEILRGNGRKTLIVDGRAIEAEKVAVTAIKKETPPVTENRTPYIQGTTSQQDPDGAALKEKSGTTAALREKMPIAAHSGDITDELIEVAGHRREFNDAFGRIGRSEIDQLFSDTFTPELAEKTFKGCLKRRLDHREIADVLAWYKTPIGMKIAEADSVWDINRKEKTLTYVTTESESGYKERRNLTAQIEKMTGASETEVRLTQSILRKIIKTIPHDFPDAKAIKERLQKEMPTLETKRKEYIERIAYTYRDLSLAELRDYLKFLCSATGRKYTAAVREAAEEITRKIAINIEKELHKDLMKLM